MRCYKQKKNGDRMLKGPFIDAKEIINKIEKNGHQAYYVGGCVRDLLLQRPIGDIDIATSAPPTKILEIFDHVIPVGMEHGTVIVRQKGVSYEVTTFRVEGNYSDHRHPDTVQFIDQIDKDLERRDFTINALAMNREGCIIDLFDGKADLYKKVIRTVGNGVERFYEDPLRIIRALRFSSQLGFQIETNTLTAMNQVKHQILTIAIERMTTEMSKLVQGKYVHHGFAYLQKTKIYDYLPILKKHPYIIDKISTKIKPLGSLSELFALFYMIETSISISTWVKSWKCSNKVRREASHLVDALKYYEKNGLNQWLVYQLPSEYHDGFVRLVNLVFENLSVSKTEVASYERTLPIRSKKELDIDGNDLVELFPHLNRGPWIQHKLQELEKEVVFGKLNNNRNLLKEWIKWNPPEIN
ncbi:CCA tRNA nucleotidyltransferase [Ornithinibacillus salinisoli]